MRLIESLLGKTHTVPPCWLMRQAGRYLPEYRALRANYASFTDLCFTPEAAAELTMQPIRRYPLLSAAIVFADILTVPHALGRTVRFVEGDGPQLTPITKAADIEALDPSVAAPILQSVAETVRRVRAMLPSDTALIGFAGAPFTVMTYMFEGGAPRGRERLRCALYAERALVDRLEDVLVRTTIDYLRAQIDAGADAVQLFDSHAGFLPEVVFVERIIAPTARIVHALKQSHPNTPVIGFPRGGGAFALRYGRETGVQAVGCDTGVSIPQMQALQNAGLCVQGNLDPYALYGDLDALRASVRTLADALRAGPFVFNLGHGIMPHTPPEAVAALLEALNA